MSTLRLCQGQGLAAAVYTQLTDVENELNGYITYDRQINKFGEEWLRDSHQEIFTDAPPLVTSAGGRLPWAYTTTLPPDGWQSLDFSDAEWDHGGGPFGANYRGAQTVTPWTTPQIWLRKTFDLAHEPAANYVIIRGVRGAQLRVWLNGVLLRSGESKGLEQLALKGNSALKTGSNLLTVEASRAANGSQASFDVRLIRSADTQAKK